MGTKVKPSLFHSTCRAIPHCRWVCFSSTGHVVHLCENADLYKFLNHTACHVEPFFTTSEEKKIPTNAYTWRQHIMALSAALWPNRNLLWLSQTSIPWSKIPQPQHSPTCDAKTTSNDKVLSLMQDVRDSISIVYWQCEDKLTWAHREILFH